MGSLSSNGLKGRIGMQWSEFKTETGTLVKNNFSEQQFQVFSIPNLQLNNIKLYFCRQFSSLPKTPKVICLQKNPDRLLVLVEKGDKLITQWLSESHCELSVLLKLKDAISAINALKNKFGPFLITEKMINISSNDNLMVWYNERYESNLVQLPLFNEENKGQNQKIMIQNLLEIFKKSHSMQSSINIFSAQPKTFIEFKNSIKLQIEQIQSLFKLNSQSEKITDSKELNKRSFTPNSQKSFALSSQKTLQKFSETQKFLRKHRKSDHTNQNKISTEKQLKNDSPFKQKLKIRFLEDESRKSSQKSARTKTIVKQKPLRYIKEHFSSNQSYSSSISSRETINEKSLVVQQGSRFSKSFHHLTEKMSDSKPFSSKTFKKKESKFSNYIIGEDKSQIMTIKMSPQRNQSQKPVNQSEQKSFQKFPDSPNLYKGCESFSSKKNFSLKSTTGTLKKTRQFEQNIRQLLEHHETIKEESDQTHKNSNNYSVESIKELKEEMKASASLSQDFNKLFSMADSQASGMEDSMRQKQFEKILF